MGLEEISRTQRETAKREELLSSAYAKYKDLRRLFEEVGKPKLKELVLSSPELKGVNLEWPDSSLVAPKAGGLLGLDLFYYNLLIAPDSTVTLQIGGAENFKFTRPAEPPVIPIRIILTSLLLDQYRSHARRRPSTFAGYHIHHGDYRFFWKGEEDTERIADQIVKIVKGEVPENDFDFNDKACFIASAVYGPGSPQVDVLVEYRNEVLNFSSLGRALVGAYYLVSPHLARRIRAHSRLAFGVRCILDALIPGVKAASLRHRQRRGD
jgi:hypothetical protein